METQAGSFVDRVVAESSEEGDEMKNAVHKRLQPISFNGKKWLYKTTFRNVEVMAVADGWAMVRISKFAPYLCPEKELEAK